MAIAGKLERPKSLTDLAVERLRAAIVEGRLGLGEQISESALAANLGISKTPVREALLRLKAEGLVEIHPQRGSFVFQLAETEVKEICRFRELIETAALAEGMAKSADALIGRLEANRSSMVQAEKAGELGVMPQLDRDFHEAILDCSSNPYLRAAYNLVSHKIQALRARLPSDNDQVQHCQHNHAMIVEEIRAGNVQRAQRVLREHIRDTEDAYLVASRNAYGLERSSA